MKVYFIGIGGVGTSGLAKFLSVKGFKVVGNDINFLKTKSILSEYKIKVYKTENLEEIENSDIVVYTSAIKNDNKGLKHAKKLSKTIFSRGELLGEILKSYYNSIGISGSHGKTTTTAMLTHILKSSLIKFTSFIGGFDSKFSNFYTDKERENIIAEICEYNKNIKFQTVKTSVILNIDNDHLDSYKTIDNLVLEFCNFANRSSNTIINNDDLYLKDFRVLTNKITYSIRENSDYKAVKIKEKNQKYSFCVMHNNKISKRIYLNVFGKHNIYNALASIVASREIFKLSFDDVIKGLNSFTGVERRFENLGELFENNVIADYCHHPSEIEKTLKVADEIFSKNYVIVFEPHTYSRTKLLLNDFIKVFSGRELILYKTYGAREKFDLKGSSKFLSKNISGSYYVNTFNSLLEFIRQKYKNKNILILGAGSLYEKIKKSTQS